MGSYPQSRFYDDIMRVTEGLSDPDLLQILVSRSYPTVRWMSDQGLYWVLMYGRQSFKVQGKHRFFGGLIVEAVGGGKGLVDSLFQAAERRGVEVLYEAKAGRLVTDRSGSVTGVSVRTPGGTDEIEAGAVVLACGGFEANPEMRTRYLGAGWELAKVRGTRYNTGDGIRMALEIGGQPYGHWSGCHSVAWDLNAPPFGDRNVADLFQKHSYPLGIVVNVLGQRFLDEGADFRNYTYAKYGREILKQPQRAAFQIFDAKVQDILRDEYHISRVTRASSGTVGGLAGWSGDRPGRPGTHPGGVQRRGAGGPIRPFGTGWETDPWHFAAQVQLGPEAGHAALHGLRGDVRHNLHLRWAQDQHRCPGAGHGG